MKIALLSAQRSGYMNARNQALSETDGVEVFVANEQGPYDAPFSAVKVPVI